MTKAEELRKKLRKVGCFNSVYIKKTGNDMFFSTAYRRVQEMVASGQYYRRIPLKECYERGLVKKGNKPVAWFENK